MSVQSYPLHWPQGFPRVKYRESGKSNSGKKLEHAIMSSNITLTITTPQDPGVAVWFVWDGLQVCIPVDRYDTPAKNLQAIHHIIEARRVELRHGTLALVRASFAGFKALPAPPGKHWRELLGIDATALVTRETVESAFKKLAQTHHPDVGGSTNKMAELTGARTLALQEVGG